MKRDMDLCRKMLLKIESEPYTGVGIKVQIEGYTEDEIYYHNLLLVEARLVEVANGAFGELDPVRLTWEGHEFLDAARDNKRWEKAKGAMVQVGGFALDVMKQLLVQYLKEDLNLAG